MVRLWLAALTFTGTAVAAGEAWGPPADGIRLGLAVSTRNVRVSVENVSDAAILVTVADLVGPRSHHLRFRFYYTTGDRQDHEVLDLDGAGVVGGRIDPLVVPILPNAVYVVAVPTEKLFVLEGDAPLDRFMMRTPGSLRVELEVRNPRCAIYGMPVNPNMTACWGGKLVSGSWRVPQ